MAGWPRPGRPRSMPPNPCASSSRSSSTVMLRPACWAMGRAWSTNHCGFLVLEGTVARVRERQPAMATASPRWRTSGVKVPPAITIRRTGRALGPLERRWYSNEPSTAPSTNARRPASSPTAGTEVATVSRSLVRRAIAAPARRSSFGVPEPTPTSSTSRRSLSARLSAPATGSVVTSPALPVARACSSTANRSSSLRSSSSAAPGPRVTPSAPPSVASPASTGRASTSAPLTRAGGSSLSESSGGDTWVGRVGTATGPTLSTAGGGPTTKTPGSSVDAPGVFGGRGVGLSRPRP